MAFKLNHFNAIFGQILFLCLPFTACLQLKQQFDDFGRWNIIGGRWRYQPFSHVKKWFWRIRPHEETVGVMRLSSNGFLRWSSFFTTENNHSAEFSSSYLPRGEIWFLRRMRDNFRGQVLPDEDDFTRFLDTNIFVLSPSFTQGGKGSNNSWNCKQNK